MVFKYQIYRFFQRTVSVVGDPPAMERFISEFDAYTKSVILEAEDRVAGHQRSVNDYMILRRDTCGAKPIFSFWVEYPRLSLRQSPYDLNHRECR